jgi:hypothetical protein
MRFAWCIPKTTNRDSECAVLAFSLQQCQHDRTSLLRCTHISCIVLFSLQICCFPSSILFLSGVVLKFCLSFFSLLFMLYDPRTSLTKLLVSTGPLCCLLCLVSKYSPNNRVVLSIRTIEIFSPKINIIFTRHHDASLVLLDYKCNLII